jgi:hypothetical protein
VSLLREREREKMFGVILLLLLCFVHSVVPLLNYTISDQTVHFGNYSVGFLKANPIYRMGDLFYYKGKPPPDHERELVLTDLKYKGTVMNCYFLNSSTPYDRNYALLNECCEQYLTQRHIPLPPESSLVCYVRLGDSVHCPKSFLFLKNFKKIIIVTILNFGAGKYGFHETKVLDSLACLQSILSAIPPHLHVEIHSSKIVDDDFCYLTRASHLVTFPAKAKGDRVGEGFATLVRKVMMEHQKTLKHL